MKRTDKILVGVLIAVALACLIMGMVGCAQTWNLTPSAKYYSALKTFDQNIETYLVQYRAASPETQAKWKKNIDPLILAANQALQTWRLSMGTTSAASKEQAWLTAQRQVMGMLISSGIIKVEGK